MYNILYILQYTLYIGHRCSSMQTGSHCRISDALLCRRLMCHRLLCRRLLCRRCISVPLLLQAADLYFHCAVCCVIPICTVLQLIHLICRVLRLICTVSLLMHCAADSPNLQSALLLISTVSLSMHYAATRCPYTVQLLF